MKIGFFSPYIPKHFGGGEKHFFDVAEELAPDNEVLVAVPKSSGVELEQQRQAYETFLGRKLHKNIVFVVSPFFGGNFLEKTLWTRQFEYFYYVTDGSLFFSLAKKNNLHIQIPLILDKSSCIERLKLKNWQIKNTNSEFTKNSIEKYWKTKIDIVNYPMIAIPARIPTKKEKIILHVGRFFKQLHAKRQDVLVDIFIALVQRHPKRTKGWKLVLVGSVEDEAYFEEVKAKAKGFAIEFIRDASHVELQSYYKKAQIYWHATGYEVSEVTHPEKVEHFGITTAEAMSYGVVPIVLGKGGQPEVVGSLKNEVLWKSKEECLALTAGILRDEKYRSQLATRARAEVQRFGAEAFSKRVREMV